MSEKRIIPSPPPGWSDWEEPMRLALEEAERAGQAGEIPVGALLLGKDGDILARGHNQCVALADPCAHAEVQALRQAGRNTRNYRLSGSILLVTLEPCLMCTGALVQARVGGVVYGARDPKAGAVESCLDGLDQYFHNHRLWHLGGVLEAECAALLQTFFAQQR